MIFVPSCHIYFVGEIREIKERLYKPKAKKNKYLKQISRNQSCRKPVFVLSSKFFSCKKTFLDIVLF